MKKDPVQVAQQIARDAPPAECRLDEDAVQVSGEPLQRLPLLLSFAKFHAAVEHLCQPDFLSVHRIRDIQDIHTASVHPVLIEEFPPQFGALFASAVHRHCEIHAKIVILLYVFLRRKFKAEGIKFHSR